MKRLLEVTIFVTSVLISLTAQARPAKRAEAPNPFSFAFRMQGLQTANKYSEPYAFFGSGLEYNFYKTYAVGLDVSFMQTTKELRTKTQEGWNDTVLSLSDRELWSNRAYQLNLKAAVSAIFVTSKVSQAASMQWGTAQRLDLTKGFGDRFSLTYGLGATEYSYEYETAYDGDDETIYNTQYVIANRLLATFSPTKVFRILSGGAVLSYHTLGDENYSALLIFGGVSYDPTKTCTIDFGVRAGYKRDEDAFTWNGPAVSKNFLGAEGTVIFLGATIKI